MTIGLTLIGQIIAFAMFTAFCMKWVWPPITQAMRERQKRIDEGLSSAKQADKTLARARANAEGILRQAKTEAQSLLDNAHQHAQNVREEELAKAHADADKVRDNGNKALAQEIIKARTALQNELAAMVVAGVKRVTSGGINASADDKVIAGALVELKQPPEA